MKQWQERDLGHIWHPCSQMKDYEDFPPIVIDRGEGVFLYDLEGTDYLDAVSSWWVNLFGHSHPRINRALTEQVQQLEHVIFANFSHKPAIALAEKIVGITPRGLNKVFFADNGSSAVEVALKMSFQYHHQKGNRKRKKFIALTDAYHGETLGALAVGDLDLYSAVFKPLMMDVVRVQGPSCYRCPYGQKRETCVAQCFEHMERGIREHQEELCGAIIEPLVQCAAGMQMYSPIYLKRLRELCSEVGIHLIADEIAVGFGRTGTMFACEQVGISPDFMCLSKGLTGGYLPMALTVTTDEIYHCFYGEYQDGKAFLHSHSYTGNPLACSVALASLEIFDEEDVLVGNRQKSEFLRQLANEQFGDHPFVGEYRQIGMIGAIELVQNSETKEPFASKLRIGYQVYRKALEEGLIIRPLGNILYFMPPYVITNDQIQWMIKTTKSSIDYVLKKESLVGENS